MSEDSKVLCEIRGQVALLRLNKPEIRNAICTQLLAELKEHMQQLADNDDVRVIVLTGEGKGFCAGADLNDTKGFVSSVRGIEDHYKPTYMEIVNINKPVIACVRGSAAGGGMALALQTPAMILHPPALFAAYSALAVAFATINVVGGYAVTNRMLEMFKKKDDGGSK